MNKTFLALGVAGVLTYSVQTMPYGEKMHCISVR